MKRNIYGAMNTNHKSLILAISLFFVLCGSISAAPGDLDPTFGIGGKLTDWEGVATGVAIQHDGKIVVVGGSSIQLGGGYYDFQVARYNPDGTPDTTFGGGTGRVTTDFDGNFEISPRVVIQADGKIVVAGISDGQRTGLALARYNPNGSLDTTFGGGSGKVLTETPNWSGHVVDVALQPDGKILGVIGTVDFDLGYDFDGLMVRYNADGSLDTSFGNGGSVLTEYELASVAVQPDGKIVTQGFWHIIVARFNTDGSPDTGFGSGGRVVIPATSFLWSIAIDPAGKIVTTDGSALFRLNVDGSPDSSFDGDGIVTISRSLGIASVVIQPDGKIVAAGSWGGDFALARFNLNGSLDTTFGGGDGISTTSYFYPNKVVLDSHGRAVVVGASGTGPAYMFAIARFLGDAPSPSCSSANPIDCPDTFVRQQYRDFLGREPDTDGFGNWMATLTGCPNGGFGEFDNPYCDRVHVSAGFVQSNEFQGRGYWILRFGYVGLNRAIGSVRSSATYTEFIPALTQIGGSNSPAQEEAAKVAYANAFVQRPDFLALFPPTMTASQYVNALESNAQVSLPNKQALSNALNAGTMTRANVLRNVVESQLVFDKYIIPAFVTMEYFGYLHRDPDTIGYQNWVNTLESNPSDYRHMIFGFIYSTEYRSRFGAP